MPESCDASTMLSSTRRIILAQQGRNRSTLKIRPPMPFSIENADLVLDTLDDVLSTVPLHQ